MQCHILNTLSLNCPSWGFPGGNNGKEPPCHCMGCKRHRLDPQVEKITCRRKCNPLQCSCLENPKEWRGWQVIVHRVTKNPTWLKRLSTLKTSNLEQMLTSLYPPLNYPAKVQILQLGISSILLLRYIMILYAMCSSLLEQVINTAYFTTDLFLLVWFRDTDSGKFSLEVSQRIFRWWLYFIVWIKCVSRRS